MPAKKTRTEFIAQSIARHGDVYDYSQVVYTNRTTKVTIVCPTHGPFEQSPYSHLHTSGCKQCSYDSRGRQRRTTIEDFIATAHKKHNNKYTYVSVAYQTAHTPVTITCPIHGPFEQSPGEHLKGYGCGKCGMANTQLSNHHRLISRDVWIDRFTTVHNDKYGYQDLPDTFTSTSKIPITCVDHGVFLQRPSDHNRGHGCKQCGTESTMLQNNNITVSAGEQAIADFIKSLNVEFVQSDRTLITPYELDIIIPTHNIAIEYCGLYWHSEQLGKHRHYHKDKLNKCSDINYQLLTIYEDEWLNRQSQVKRKIAHMLGKSHTPTVYARKCTIVPVSTQQKKTFFDDNHIQGNGPGSINIGLEFEGKLVACMSFIKQKNQHYLNRYATATGVPGGFNKLLKYFQSNYKWNRIVSFADQRWSTGHLYESTGWVHDSTIPPDYYYSPDGNVRVHKFNYRRKNLPVLLDSFDPNLSEWENCKQNRVYRIWDCGKLRYVIDNIHT